MSRHDLVYWLAARRVRRRHLFAAVLTAILVLLSLLRPARVHAACGVMDVAACLDGVQYSFWHGIASFLWTMLRTMLQITYQLDQFRHWLVTVAFSGAYQATVTTIPINHTADDHALKGGEARRQSRRYPAITPFGPGPPSAPANPLAMHRLETQPLPNERNHDSWTHCSPFSRTFRTFWCNSARSSV